MEIWKDIQNNSSRSCNRQPVYCFDLDEYFNSASEAAVHLGICRTSITKACRGELTQAGGKWWCYAKDKNSRFTSR